MASIKLRPYPLWLRYVLENKTNSTSYPNIGLLKTVIEEEWNKMFEEVIWRDADRFESMLIQ